MTIRFLKQWNGNSPDAIVTLAGAEETRLVNLGFASFDLDGDADAETLVKAKTNPLTGVVGISVGGTAVGGLPAPVSSDAAENRALIQSIIETSGHVVIQGRGNVYVDDTIILPSQ